MFQERAPRLSPSSAHTTSNSKTSFPFLSQGNPYASFIQSTLPFREHSPECLPPSPQPSQLSIYFFVHLTSWADLYSCFLPNSLGPAIENFHSESFPPTECQPLLSQVSLSPHSRPFQAHSAGQFPCSGAPSPGVILFEETGYFLQPAFFLLSSWGLMNHHSCPSDTSRISSHSLSPSLLFSSA